MTVREIIEQEVSYFYGPETPTLEKRLTDAFKRIAEAAAREAVRYLAVGDSQEWAEDEVVQAVLGAEDTKR